MIIPSVRARINLGHRVPRDSKLPEFKQQVNVEISTFSELCAIEPNISLSPPEWRNENSIANDRNHEPFNGAFRASSEDAIRNHPLGKHARFAVAMAEHVWQILTGRKVLLPPQDIEDSLFVARRRAYLKQREMIGAVADHLASHGFNLKIVFKKLIASPFYRADGLATAVTHPQDAA